MKIENLRYKVISRDSNIPEVFPKKGDVYELLIQDEQTESEVVTLTAEYIEKMGPYAQVRGKGKPSVEERVMSYIANYEATHIFPKFNLIGDIVFKKIINED